MDDYAAFNAILSPLIGEQLVINKWYPSPLPGRTENVPSFRVSEWEGRLHWRDWGKGKQRNDLIGLVAHLQGWSFDRAEKFLTSHRYITPDQVRRVAAKWFRPTWAKLTPEGQRIWRGWNIEPKTAHFYGVRSSVSLTTKDSIVHDCRVDPPAFFYIPATSARGWQWYCPKPKDFLREAGLLIGYDQLPWVGEMMLIVSGMKDGLAAFEASHVPIIAGNGEGDYPTLRKKMPEFRKRFKKIAILMDPDKPGREAEELLSNELEVPRLPFSFVDNEQDLCKLGVSMGMDWLGDNILDGFSQL